MASQNFNTSNKTFRQMFGNGLAYKVPIFQRDYSWTETEWDDLWNDVLLTLSAGGNASHYMGSVVLSSKDNRRFEIIDGQQRLTTLSILVLAILKCIKDLAEKGIDADRNLRRYEQLRTTYIGYLDPVTLVTGSKLALNRSNNAYYQNYIVPLLPMPKAKLKFSDNQMRKSFEWFHAKLVGKFGTGGKGEALAQFVEDITDRLFFNVIDVDDELNAFTVFETFNSRGVRLSPTDIVKNYLFSVVYLGNPHETAIATLEQRWDGIVGKIGDANFTDFLRVHWNSKNARVRESALFKEIRNQINDQGRVFALIRALDDDASTYAALGDPDSDLWAAELKPSLKELRLFGVKQPWPMLLSARRVFDDAAFAKILHACSVVSFRYNVIGSGATGDQETVYSGIARDIFGGTLESAADVIRALKPVYKPDAEFRSAFAGKSLKTSAGRNKAIATYILFKIEARLDQPLDDRSPKFSLEHILPVHAEEGWSQFSSEQAEDMVYRIGNLAILETPLNRDAGNRDFTEKRAIYAKSDIIGTRQIAENNAGWDSGRLQKRQTEMAKLATSIWRIPQLD